MNKDYERYVIKEKIPKFVEYCENNCLDFYSCGIITTLHLVLRNLMLHKEIGIFTATEELTPEMAWKDAIEQTPYHSGASISIVAIAVAEFSIRGEEFKKWAKKDGGFQIKWT